MQKNTLNLVLGNDSSLSAYSEKYQQSYHCKSLGAYTESMIKHILPALVFMQYNSNLDSKKYNEFKDKITKIDTFINNLDSINLSNYAKKIKILDICFGLGYNAMLAMQHFGCFESCEIYSPEKDSILENLVDFKYKNINNANLIITELIKNATFKQGNATLYFLHGNALDFIESFVKNTPNSFDIIFQDAFSMQQNAELWSEEYFKNLYKIMKQDSIITTYAKARQVLTNATCAGFHTFKHKEGSIFIKSNKL